MDALHDMNEQLCALNWAIFGGFAMAFLFFFTLRALVESRQNRIEQERLREEEEGSKINADNDLGDGKEAPLDPTHVFAAKDAPTTGPATSTRVKSIREVMKQRQADLAKLRQQTTGHVKKILHSLRCMCESAWALLAAIQFKHALQLSIKPDTHMELLGYAVLMRDSKIFRSDGFVVAYMTAFAKP